MIEHWNALQEVSITLPASTLLGFTAGFLFLLMVLFIVIPNAHKNKKFIVLFFLLFLYEVARTITVLLL